MLQSALQNVLTALEELEMGFLKIGLFHGWKGEGSLSSFITGEFLMLTWFALAEPGPETLWLAKTLSDPTPCQGFHVGAPWPHVPLGNN